MDAAAWLERCKFYNRCREYKVMACGHQRIVVVKDYDTVADFIQELRNAPIEDGITAVQSWRGWRDAW